MTTIPTLTEKQFQAQVLELARLRGWLAYHTLNSIGSAAGFPDLVLLRKDRMVVAELKVGRNKLSERQTYWIFAFRDAGVDCRVWYPSDWPAIERTLA